MPRRRNDFPNSILAYLVFRTHCAGPIPERLKSWLGEQRERHPPNRRRPRVWQGPRRRLPARRHLRVTRHPYRSTTSPTSSRASRITRRRRSWSCFRTGAPRPPRRHVGVARQHSRDGWAKLSRHRTMPERSEREQRQCDECGSNYFADTSQMHALCPACAHGLYGYANCPHDMQPSGPVARRCARCGWDGSRSAFLRSRE